MLTLDYLKDILNYDEITGIFTWKTVHIKNQVKIGDIAGYRTIKGYVEITIKNKAYKAHRLAWLYITGLLPKGDIDHIDGNTLNNRINNLRDVSTRTNCQNRKSHRLGRLVGTTYVKQNNKWKARTQIQGKTIQIGTYNTELEAHIAYNNFLQEMLNGKK